jgi:GxxExxY protein
MPFEEQQLTAKIIECIIKVHQILGPGFLENIYRKALVIELRKNGLVVDCEKNVSVFYYSDQEIGKHRLDLLVQNKIVVELKTVEVLHGRYYAQVKSYLRAAGCHVGLLVNFASQKAEFRRIEI